MNIKVSPFLDTIISGDDGICDEDARDTPLFRRRSMAFIAAVHFLAGRYRQYFHRYLMLALITHRASMIVQESPERHMSHSKLERRRSMLAAIDIFIAASHILLGTAALAHELATFLEKDTSQPDGLRAALVALASGDVTTELRSFPAE